MARAFVLLTSGLVLCACQTADLFATYDLPEDPSVEATPYPRLVDVPETPPAGSYGQGIPDPAIGVDLRQDLAAEAAAAQIRARALSEPVLSEAEREELFRRARRRQPQ